MRTPSLVLSVVVLFLLLPGTALAGLITNPGFETGNFSGWTQSGNAGNTVVSGGAAYSGSYGAVFGPMGSLGYISQTISTTPGETYEISFWVTNLGGPTNRAELWWGGNLVDSADNMAPTPWTRESYIVTAASSSTAVRLGFRQDPSFWNLDEVDVTAVPEPSSLLLFGAGGCFLIALGLRRRSS